MSTTAAQDALSNLIEHTLPPLPAKQALPLLMQALKAYRTATPLPPKDAQAVEQAIREHGDVRGDVALQRWFVVHDATYRAATLVATRLLNDTLLQPNGDTNG